MNGAMMTVPMMIRCGPQAESSTAMAATTASPAKRPIARVEPASASGRMLGGGVAVTGHRLLEGAHEPQRRGEAGDVEEALHGPRAADDSEAMPVLVAAAQLLDEELQSRGVHEGDLPQVEHEDVGGGVVRVAPDGLPHHRNRGHVEVAGGRDDVRAAVSRDLGAE